MVLFRPVLFVWCYIALLLIATTTPQARAHDFLSCSTSQHLKPHTQQLEHASNRAKEVFARLINVEAFLIDSQTPRISIESSARPNAFVRDSSVVVITVPALEIVENSSELAFILAHELAHVALRHRRPGDPTNELHADRLALTLVQRAGFDPCASLVVLARLGAPYAASLESFGPRLKALQVNQGAACNTPPLLTPHQIYHRSSIRPFTLARLFAEDAEVSTLDRALF